MNGYILQFVSTEYNQTKTKTKKESWRKIEIHLRILRFMYFFIYSFSSQNLKILEPTNASKSQKHFTSFFSRNIQKWNTTTNGCTRK